MVISFVNKKGGTGKTTSTLNVGKALQLDGFKVLLIDLDPQGNLSYSCGVQEEECMIGEAIYNGYFEYESIHSVNGLDIVSSNNDLINYEVDFIRIEFPYNALKQLLETVREYYDYILIDCPPSASYLTISALIASDTVVIPMVMDVLAVQGLQQILETVAYIKSEYNPGLFVAGVMGVIIDERRQMTFDIMEHVRDNYPVAILNNYIRANVKAAEAPSHGMSVIEYAPKSSSARDYLNVTRELLTII